MGNIIAGLVLIGIGLAGIGGGSIFYGDFNLFSIFFDGLGLFWIVKGVRSLMADRAA